MDQLQRTLRNRLVIISIGLVFITTGLFWLFGTYLALTTLEATLISGLIGAILGAFVSLIVASRIGSSLVDIRRALDHVGPGAPNSPPPFGKNDATKAIIKDIYRLAAGARDLTASIDDQRLFLNQAIDLLPVSLAVFDRDQRLAFLNTTAAGTLGVEGKTLAGLAVGQVFDWLFQTDETYDVWLEQARGNKIHSDKLWERVSIVRNDGTRVIGDVAAHYEKDAPHNMETLIVFTDRTPEYMADEAQLDFVAVAAHELRGPITVIRGYLDVFKQEMNDIFTVEQQTLLQKMNVSAEMLSLYVNNILNVARVDQRGMRLHIIKSDWREIIKEAYGDLALRSQARGRVLTLKLPESIPEVAVDRVSIIEVINNLVDNAIKYSREGGEIVLTVTPREGGLVETTVQDYGIGIAQAVIGNLFKKFYRSHHTRAGVSGTGLGLYLCKSIIDAHGGNIWVRSQEGQGSTFGFDLPVYDTIADSLKKGDNAGQDIKRSSQGWIKNHAMYRR